MGSQEANLANAKARGAAAVEALRKTCPPELFSILEKEGSITDASKASGISKYTITQIAKKRWPIRPRVQEKIEAYHRGEPIFGKTSGKKKHKNPTEKLMPEKTQPPEPAIEIPQWDKKMATVKIKKANGKAQTFKMPALIARLFEMHGNVKSDVGRALGFSSWNTVNDAITSGKYEPKLHAKAYCAVNGLPLPNGKGPHADEIVDNYSLGLAICLVGLNEYERVEELADVVGGSPVFKMSTGTSGMLVIFRIKDVQKMETFKRLARRDAKRIACP